MDLDIILGERKVEDDHWLTSCSDGVLFCSGTLSAFIYLLFSTDFICLCFGCLELDLQNYGPFSKFWALLPLYFL